MPGHAEPRCLVLRLAGPLQSWGTASQFNRRETAGEPTKGGITGLLAAAQGRRRSDPIEDLLALRLAVRTDQPGSLLRDYHTVSDYRGGPLPSAAVNTKGVQKPAGDKHTHVTQRYYLQDAIFVAAITGPPSLLLDLATALHRPAFPLALGRRSCPPTQPLVLHPTPAAPADLITAVAHTVDPDAAIPGTADPATTWEHALWAGDLLDVLTVVPWQASTARITALRRSHALPARVDLPVTLDDPAGDDQRNDVPRSFDPAHRGFVTRRVRNTWATVVGPVQDGADALHDPFALLGW